MLFMNHIILPSINERNVDDWTYTGLIIIISIHIYYNVDMLTLELIIYMFQGLCISF